MHNLEKVIYWNENEGEKLQINTSNFNTAREKLKRLQSQEQKDFIYIIQTKTITAQLSSCLLHRINFNFRHT